MDIEALKKEQMRLSKKVMLSDDIGEIRLIAGCDSVYVEKTVIYSIIVLDYITQEVKEMKYTLAETKMPHVPGLVAYREAQAAVETYHKLELDPDVLIIAGNGVCHPRKLGIASHIGLLIDKPTIGIEKSLLCGELMDDTVYMDKEAVAKKLETKQHAKPIFISPGHRITLRRALEIVRRCLGDHKLPEPIHLAHKYGNKIKANIRNSSGRSLP